MNIRNAYLDNTKFILIFLVVFGHFLSPYRLMEDEILSLYHFIFIFHMPAFIMVSGYLSKNFHKKGYYKKIVTKIMIPYLIFQTVYTIYYNLLYDERSFTFQYFTPRWAMWFLLCMIFWKLLLPLFAKFPMYIGLGISLLIGIGIGYIDFGGYEKTLSISRMVFFFPFFLLGYYLSKKGDFFEKLTNLKVKIVSVVVILLIMAVSYLFLQDKVYTNILYGTNNYENYKEVLIRFVQYGVSIVGTLALMSLIPKKGMFYTSVGSRSLYVYLLHGFILKWFFETEYGKNINTINEIIILFIFSIFVTFFLGNKWIDVVLSFVKEKSKQVFLMLRFKH